MGPDAQELWRCKGAFGGFRLPGPQHHRGGDFVTDYVKGRQKLPIGYVSGDEVHHQVWRCDIGLSSDRLFIGVRGAECLGPC